MVILPEVPVDVAAPGVGPRPRAAGRHVLDRLTAKENDVLRLMAEGHSNASIAELLHLTARTVETHTRRIFAKLDLAESTATHRRVLAVLAHLRAQDSSAD